MQIVSGGLRFLARVIVLLLVGYLLVGRCLQGQQVVGMYANQLHVVNEVVRYYGFRVRDFSRNSIILEYVLYLDIMYLIVTGGLVLFGQRAGGWMLALYYLIYLAIDAPPHLLQTPRMPFSSHRVMQYIKYLALIGAAIAFTAPIVNNEDLTDKKEQWEEEIDQQEQKWRKSQVTGAEQKAQESKPKVQ